MITYTDISSKEIVLIRELWIKNKEYHEELEENFKEQYAHLVFEERIKGILEGQKELKITIAKVEDRIVGYCLSSIVGNVGEVVSLHVLENQRGKGIGIALTQLHIDWMKDKQCKEIGLYVASGNEKTINFYRKLGLHPNLVYMQLKE
ncbi:MAG: GNAT family N-acetyltransferase [Marinifilaceae bacterium]